MVGWVPRKRRRAASLSLLAWHRRQMRTPSMGMARRFLLGDMYVHTPSGLLLPILRTRALGHPRRTARKKKIFIQVTSSSVRRRRCAGTPLPSVCNLAVPNYHHQQPYCGRRTCSAFMLGLHYAATCTSGSLLVTSSLPSFVGARPGPITRSGSSFSLRSRIQRSPGSFHGYYG